MRLVHTAPDQLELRGRRSVRGPLLVGAVLLFGPTLATLLADPPLTASRVFIASVIALIAATLIHHGWPRLHRVRLDPGRRTVRVDGAAPVELGTDPWLQLGPAPPHAPSGVARYAVTLEGGSAGSVLLLASHSPAAALRDLVELRKACPLPVSPGWGLPAAGPPWIDRAQGAELHPERPLGDDLVGSAARRRVATTLLVGAAAIGAGLAAQVSDRVAHGDAATTVSVGLPVLGILALAVVAIAVGTAGVRLVVERDLNCEQRLFGLTLSRRTVARESIRHAYLVGPEGAAVRHLLLDTTDGPVAFPCDAEEGPRLLSALSRSAS